jgi:hypothetical protein
VPLSEFTIFILGAIIGLVRANAGVKAAKSISELTKSMDNFVAIFIRIIPYLILASWDKRVYSKPRALGFSRLALSRESPLAKLIPLLYFWDAEVITSPIFFLPPEVLKGYK